MHSHKEEDADICESYYSPEDVVEHVIRSSFGNESERLTESHWLGRVVDLGADGGVSGRSGQWRGNGRDRPERKASSQ
jgi:hypothetical protein